MEFIPYKSNETLENRFYQVPQELFENSLYKISLDLASKFLYAFILDRLTLSQKNHWIDEQNNIYLIFTRQEVQDKLNLSEKTVTKAFKQLIECNLIFEKRQELGKPNLIYVGKIQHEEITEQEILQNENISLHKELSKQTEIINIAEDFVKEKENMENENKNLEQIIWLLKETTEQNQEDLKVEYENKIDHIEHKYQKKIKELEKENKSLNKIIDKFKDNLKKFMKWLCHKFSYPCEDDLIRDFEEETYYNINFEKQLDTSRFQKDDNEMDYDM